MATAHSCALVLTGGEEEGVLSGATPYNFLTVDCSYGVVSEMSVNGEDPSIAPLALSA